jgi:G:T-mismatch repair DNA endonuclease (very short patch repair protein)
MQESIDLCMHTDCKSSAVTNEIEGVNTRCQSHTMDNEAYQKTLDYINRFREIHADQYDYFKSYYVHHREKIIVTCREHGDFKIRSDQHLSGSGCKECGKFKKYRKTTEDFINDAKKVHGDKYDYSLVDYKLNTIPVIIKCKVHDEFEQKPINHIIGKGCPKCTIKENAESRKCTTEQFIEKAIKKHGDKYNYDKTIYTGSTDTVIISCLKHGDFEQVAINHLSGNGCSNCGIEKSNGLKCTTENFIEKARKVHGDKYDYSDVVYINTKTHVMIRCELHGIFMQYPPSHLSGSICPKCQSIEQGLKQRHTIDEFIEKSRKKHGDKYDYSNTIYTKNKDKVIIKCPEHGEFQQVASDHLTGYGCKKCAIDKRANTCRSTKDEVIRRANEIHNNAYDYSLMEYKNNSTRVDIICHKKFKDGTEHGIFRQNMICHIHDKNGCPKCSSRHYSKVQIEWLESITLYTGIKIQHAENNKEHNIKGTYKYADGYSSEFNTVFEFHGCFYHGCPECYPDRNKCNEVCSKTFNELYENTLKKEQDCIDNGYNLVTVWECEWNKLKTDPIKLFKYMQDVKERISSKPSE